jgi:NAD(P)-dependent dehydrogenase (short-subunit alcohol dehydrogenase family)
VDGDAERLFAEFDKQADCLDILANNAGFPEFIASDDARWITGQIIDATGGMHL